MFLSDIFCDIITAFIVSDNGFPTKLLSGGGLNFCKSKYNYCYEWKQAGLSHYVSLCFWCFKNLVSGGDRDRAMNFRRGLEVE